VVLANHIQWAARSQTTQKTKPPEEPLLSGALTFERPGLREFLHEFLTHEEKVRTGGDWIHASSLFNLCTRQYVLASEMNEVMQVVRVNDRSIYDIGIAMQEVMRNKYLGPLQILYGKWRCQRCKSLIEGLMPKERHDCGGKFRYEETVFYNHELNIFGSTDGILLPRPDFGLAGRGVLEIKSIEGALFKHLRQPQPEHIFRTNVYMFLSGMRWAVILYWSKSKEPQSPFKEFGLRYDPSVAEKVRCTMEELRNGGQKKCGDISEKRAKKCFAREPCFRTLK
jgi:hypothetical protein